MKIKGITKRWLRDTLLVVVLTLVLFVSIFMITIRSHYYETVEMKLSSQYSDSVATFFSLYTGGTNDDFRTGASEFVENYSQKGTIEVWVLDKDGNVVVSSSGFEIGNVDIPDYDTALNSSTRIGEYTGRTDNGEKIMAMTYLLPAVNNENTGAVRYMISLDKVDLQLYKIAVICFLAVALVIVLVALSGLFFIKSIVSPLREINDTAKRIAKGDFNARIESEYDDEIGELCQTINSMAEEISYIDKMKYDFISTVSHEMRTPLTAIKGWGETLLQIGDSDPALTKRGIEVIIHESTRITGVVEDLLDLSKMMNGRLTLRIQKIDVLAELDEAVFVFKERSMREGVELSYNVPHTPAPMDGDPDRIKQVFVNILDNAFKYTQQGGIINVSAEFTGSQEENNYSIEIAIADTGCGIAEEDLPRVKEKFYKSNISVRGSGIGLAVCDEIINLHKGTLKINSILGEGTIILIRLPVEFVEVIEEIPLLYLEEIEDKETDDGESS